MQDNWISVKDKLPEDRTGVEVRTTALCQCQSGFKDGRFEYDDQCEEGVAIIGMGTPDKVTHWRPITKPSHNG